MRLRKHSWINKQIFFQKLLEQLSGNANQRPPTVRPTLTTTPYSPFQPLPNPSRRQPRPILDGLAWLWRTWQDTAPTTRPRRPAVSSQSELTLDSEEDTRVPLPRPAIGLFGASVPGFGASAPSGIGDDSSNVSYQDTKKYQKIFQDTKKHQKILQDTKKYRKIFQDIKEIRSYL